MAKIELDNKFLGSSQDNFLVFANDTGDRPYVTIYFLNNGSNPVGQLVIKDAMDEDGYNKTITYSPSSVISDSSFKCMPNDNIANTFALLECLRKNQIFYDIKLIQDIPNVGIVIRAYIDSSTKYSITAGSIMVIGGTYSSYVPKEPNKFVLLENTADNQITLEKYTFGEDVSFNVTSPFEHMSFMIPFNVKLLAYRINDNSVSNESIANNSFTVLPTTLSKFQDVKLDDYCYNGYDYVNWLTNNMDRTYNYGEIAALSMLSTKNVVTLEKKYYSPSGQYLYLDNGAVKVDHNANRYDFYFELLIDYVESFTNKQVGYVEVNAVYDGEIITYPVIYHVEPKCNQNNEIFFVNELGGIDSYNFLGERIYEASIDDQTTYFKNPIRKWTNLKEIEVVGQKLNTIKHTLTTNIINSRVATWLNELNKSKYAFVLEGGTIKKIIVTDFDISVSDRENSFEIQMTYQDSDNNIKL